MKLLIVSILLIISLLHRVQAQQTIRFQGIQNNRTVFRKVSIKHFLEFVADLTKKMFVLVK